MIDFQNSKAETLFAEPKTSEETASTDLELKSTKNQLAEPEKKPSRTKKVLSAVAPTVICLVVVGGIFAAAIPALNSNRDRIRQAIDDGYRSSLVSVSESVEEGANELPESTEVSGAFAGGAGTLLYKDSSNQILNSEPVAGMDGYTYKISGTVDHYTVEMDLKEGRAYSYDSLTEKTVKKSREE